MKSPGKDVNAINRLTLVPSNPVYGLNATGGALARSR
jgi:hypothetical protein